ncbi:MAG: TasA family protein [Haloplanus sp.]
MSDDNKFELTRRRALGGIAVIGAIGASAGAGTTAYFSDEVQTQDNTIQSGSIDLRTNGDNAPTTTVNVGPVGPGQSGSQSLNLNNVGTIDGYVSLEFGTPDSRNHLTEVLEVTVSVGGNVVRRGTFDSVFDGEGEWSNADIPLGGGATKPLTIDWSLPGAAGNDVQNLDAIGDITILLNQQRETFADIVVGSGSGANVSSIQEAVTDVPDGGVILVRNGTYNEGVTVDKANLTLASKNPLGAKIRTSAPATNKAIEVDGVSGITIDGFDISFDGTNSPNSEKYAVRARAVSDGLTVRNCDIGRFSTSDNAGGAVRATGIVVTGTQGPATTPAEVTDPIIENNVFNDIKTTGGTDSSDSDNDSKAKGVAMNGNVLNASITHNDFTNIGAAGGSSESPDSADEVSVSGVNGTEKPRGISLVEDSNGTGPRNFTVLNNLFQNIVGTWGQPAIFVGGSNSLGSDHEVYDNEFHHPVDNLSADPLTLRNNTWVNDADGDGVPELVAPDADNDGGNLVNRGGGSSYDTTYTI